MSPARLLKLHAHGSVRPLLLLAGVLLVWASGVSAASAESLAPWWGVTTGARPTSLQPGRKTSEVVQVQEIVTSQGEALGFKGVVFSIGAGGRSAGLFASEPLAKELSEPENPVTAATAGNIERALGGGAIPYPPGSVTVEGGPGGEAPLLVTSVGPESLPALEVAALAEIGSAEAKPVSERHPNGQVFVAAQNLGDAATAGKVSLADQLPPGVTAIGIARAAGSSGPSARQAPSCSLKSLTCTFGEKCSEAEAGESRCVLPAFEQIELRIAVVVAPGAEPGESVATVSGGGASSVTAAHHIEVGGADRFGIEDWQQVPENEGGSIDTQAGSHPFQLTNVVTLNSQTPDSQGQPRTVALPRNVVAELPAGLIGNPTPFAQCTDTQFAAKVQEKEAHGEATTPINECPATSAIGVAAVTVNEANVLHFANVLTPIFNMVPRAGEPARFGFKVGASSQCSSTLRSVRALTTASRSARSTPSR